MLIEGFRLFPSLVRPSLARREHAVWLIATPTFRQAAFLGRSSEETFWTRTSDPSRALSNLLARDALFSEAVATEAAREQMRAHTVDGSSSIEDTASLLVSGLGLRC